MTYDNDIVHQRVLALVRSRDFATAITVCQQQIQESGSTSRAEGFHNLAYTQWAAGEAGKALEAIERAIELAPMSPAHRDIRARWSAELEHYTLVIDDCTIMLEIEHTRHSEAFVTAALVLRAFALMHLGHLQAAVADLDRLDDEGPFRIRRQYWTKSDLLNEINRLRAGNTDAP